MPFENAVRKQKNRIPNSCNRVYTQSELIVIFFQVLFWDLSIAIATRKARI